MLFFSKNSKDDIVVVIDISSASVGGVVFKQNKNGPAIVIGSSRVPANFLFDVSFDASWRCSLNALKHVISDLLKFYPSGPNKIMCVFSSPWFSSHTSVVSLEKNKNFEINQSFLEKITEREKNDFANKHEGAEFIECENIKTEINGYFVKNPENKEAKTLKMWIYMSLAMRQVTKDIKKEIEKNFGHVALKFFTGHLLMFKVLRGIMGNGKSFSVIDLGGEITDIFIIKDNILDGSVSFPKGTNVLYRNIAKRLNTFIEEARSVARTFSDGKRSVESSEKVYTAIKESEEEWKKYFEKSLEGLLQENPLPQNVFLIGDNLAIKHFGRHVSEDVFSKYSTMGKPFVVRKISPEWLSRHFKFQTSEFSEHPVHPILDNDTSLTFESYFANQNL